ncbi:MAG: TIGR01458 family HAD-type hydrolase, partial [Gemmatimonadota bacterium]|nr:TIGR01458 family HAD-type hydrolase [Gemmatimonadota bacterium]
MIPAPAGVLLDLDGTIYELDAPIPGAAEAVARLRRAGIAVRFCTNTT